MVRDPGDAERLKSPSAGVTTKVTGGALWLMLPLVPVMVSG